MLTEVALHPVTYSMAIKRVTGRAFKMFLISKFFNLLSGINLSPRCLNLLFRSAGHCFRISVRHSPHTICMQYSEISLAFSTSSLTYNGQWIFPLWASWTVSLCKQSIFSLSKHFHTSLESTQLELNVLTAGWLSVRTGMFCPIVSLEGEGGPQCVH